MMLPGEEQRQLFPRMLLVVTKAEDGEKLKRLYEEQRVPIWYQCRGKGTAPSEIMDIFGLSGTTRLITISFLPRQRTRELLTVMTRRLAFRQKGGGIAVSIPVTGLQNRMLHFLKEETQMEERMEEDMPEIEGKQEYVVIWVSAARGYSDDVVDAARAAGARGGTVIKGRRCGNRPASQVLGIPSQEEQDFVMIIVPKAKKREIMSAIVEKCGLDTDARGIVLSLPVDETVGLA